MPKPQYEFHQPNGPWKLAFGDTPGITEQILSFDPDTGDVTRLLEFAAGADVSHVGVLTHNFWEEVYIVWGELQDVTSGQTFEAGMYACRPPGMPHGPYRSQTGVRMVETRYFRP